MRDYTISEKGKEISLSIANQKAPDIHKQLEAVGKS